MPYANVVIRVEDPSAHGVALALKKLRVGAMKAGLATLMRHDSKLFAATTRSQRRKIKSKLHRKRVKRRAVRAEQRQAEAVAARQAAGRPVFEP